MKKALKILVVVAVVFLVLGLAKNVLIQTVLGTTLSKAAHVPVSIGSTDAKLLASSIRLKNVRVSNPKGFQDNIMIDIPQIYIDFDPRAFTKGVAHFEEVRLDLKEVIVIKNKTAR